MRTRLTGSPEPTPYDDDDLPGRGLRVPAGQRQAGGLSQRALGALGILAVVLVLAVPVLFGLSHITTTTSQGASPAATRVPPAQAPAGFTSYVADAYSLAVPAGWTHASKGVATGQGTVQADTFGDGRDTQAVIGVASPVPANQLQMIVDGVAQRYFPPNVPQALGAGGPRTYNGTTWVSGDYTVATGSLGSQTTYELRVLAANFGAQTVIVVLQAKQSAFAATDTAQFEAIMQSFTFG